MAKSGVAKFPEHVLGHGVDCTGPSPLQNLNRTVEPVRIVTESGASANIIFEKPAQMVTDESYSLKSIESLQATFKGSFDGEVAPIQVQIEGEYAREKSTEMHSTCIKHYTRTIRFKPISQGTPEWSESKFQENLYKHFIKKFKESEGVDKSEDVKKSEGVEKSSMYDEIDKKLQVRPRPPELYPSFVTAAYNFIKTEGVTHYVHQIDLGAAKFTLSISDSETKTKKGRALAKLPIPGTGGVGIEGGSETSDSLSTVTSEKKTIGEMGEDNAVIVEPGNDKSEGVIGYNLLPITELIKNPAVKAVVRDAVLLYFNQANGPFIISGGASNTTYLKVNAANEVRVTKEKSEASLFEVEKTVAKGEFLLLFIGSQQEFKENKLQPPLYLMANPGRWSGQNTGPLTVARRTSASVGAKFILMTFPDDKNKSPRVYIETWERKLCFIRVAPRGGKARSYVGLREDLADMNNSITVCMHSKKEDGKDNVWLQFQVHRPKWMTEGRPTVFRGPPSGSEAASSSESVYDFEDFSDEFDQVLDSGDEGFNFD